MDDEHLPYIEIFKHLSPTSLNTYKLVSKNARDKAEHIMSDWWFWRISLETFVDAPLSKRFNHKNDTPLNYYKTLYLNVFRDKNVEIHMSSLAEKGRYEYVWLAIKKFGYSEDSIFNLHYVKTKAIEKGYNDTVQFITKWTNRKHLNDSNEHMSSIVNCEPFLYTAVTHNNLTAAHILLDNIIVSETSKCTYVVIACIRKGWVDVLDCIYTILPSSCDHHTMLRVMLEPGIKNRAAVLKFYLSTNPTHPSSMEEYLGTRTYLCTRSMKIILESNMFIKDTFNYRCSAQSSYDIWVLYQPVGENLAHVLNNALYGVRYLEMILSKTNVDKETAFRLYENAVAIDNSSLDVLLKYCPLERHDLITIMTKSITTRNMKKRSLATLTKHVNVTMKYVCTHMLIYEEGNDGNIDYCLKIGIPLKYIGDSMLYRCGAEDFKILLVKGYNAKPHLVELIQHYIYNVSMLYTIFSQLDVSGVDTVFELSDKHKGITKLLDQNNIKYINKVEFSGQYRSKRKDIFSRNDESVWTIADAGTVHWNHTIFHMLTREHICRDLMEIERDSIMLCMEKHIVRSSSYQPRVVRSFWFTGDNRLFPAYLDLISGFQQQQRVTITEGDNNDITVNICGLEVTLKYDSYTGVYRGMDMFSSTGYPLTTVEEIRARRSELKARLGM